MAKFVLTYSDAEKAQAMGTDNLSVAEDMPAARQILAQGHPDLLVIRRPVDEKTKKAKSVIPVDQVRKTSGFFGKSAGAGGWRVCIVDSADEMNANSANALLKVLEEPPAKSLFLLVSHQPGRLLPTIRSRCRQLAMPALSSSAMDQVLGANGADLGADDIAAIDVLAEGSAGRALTIASGDGLELYRSMVRLICQLPRPDIAAMHTLAD
ncbi:MAG TPA: DNA polymerase III subunit delta', partial [Rhodobiaceae bacterium]|nr:DNA polymerase III subunit delta' [Rhodobiaceae bacterium]